MVSLVARPRKRFRPRLGVYRDSKNDRSLTPSGPEVIIDKLLALQLAPKRQAEPRFAPGSPLSAAAAVPRPKSPALSVPAALSESTDLRITHPNPTMRLPDPIPLKIKFPISPRPKIGFWP